MKRVTQVFPCPSDGHDNCETSTSDLYEEGNIASSRSDPIDLPEPHPHDYDWRFNYQTLDLLMRSLYKLAPGGGQLLLLGAPSLLTELRWRHPIWETRLIDRNQVLTQYLHSLDLPDFLTCVQHDLLVGGVLQTGHEADAVICDPPWYPEYYRAFLVQAAASAKLGASVLVSLLPTDTRPGAKTDRKHVLEFAVNCGMDVQEIKPKAIRYITPTFERTSLHATQQPVEDEWRAGDLLVLNKTVVKPIDDLAQLLQSAGTVADDTSCWEEILFGRYKVILRGPFDDYDDRPDLTSIEPNNILPSVSRRYPRRRYIDLWFWDNRVFGTSGRVALRAALRTLAGLEVDEADKKVPSERLAEALYLLAPLLPI